MRFEEAISLAKRVIKEVPSLQVLALGRVLPLDEVKPDTPWLVSIQVPGWAKPTVLRTPEDLDKFKSDSPKYTKATPAPATKALF